MTIDERLERLTERHEALTQSMELFQHDMAEMRAAAAERDAKTDQRISRILDLVEKQAGNIDKLAPSPTITSSASNAWKTDASFQFRRRGHPDRASHPTAPD